jgi:PEP-CTERM motif
MSFKSILSLAFIAAMGLHHHAAQAADLQFVGRGALLPVVSGDGLSYMEVWGFGASPAYALPATLPGDPFATLISGSAAASAFSLSRYGLVDFSFSYDPDAAPTTVSPNGGASTYGAAPFVATISGPGMAPVDLQSGPAELRVSIRNNAHTQVVNVGTAQLTVEGPIPGNSFFYSAPAQPAVAVDLVSLLGPTAFVQGSFTGLNSFSTLPVRLTPPTEFRLVALEVYLQRSNPAVTFTVTPPTSLPLGEFNVFVLDMYYDGVFGVSVDAGDFVTPEAYAAAQAWVQGNLRQINFEQLVQYELTSLVASPVPEPGSLALMLAGMMVAGAWARKRCIVR